jgi:predicted anti-sigma-YlaC factor YlaD
MNCEAIREQLLQSEEPARPSAGLLRHLGQCPACRAYQRQLLELEAGVRELAAPPSALRDRLVARLQVGELPTPAAPRPSPWRSTLKERAQQKLALALTLAATLALFALGWGMWPHGAGTPTGPGGEVATPLGKVRELTESVRRLEREVLHDRLAADVLEVKAAIFVEFVEVDLPARAEALTKAQRAAVLPGVLDQLRRSESALARAAAQDESEHLRRMARAARATQVRLRAMLG